MASDTAEICFSPAPQMELFDTIVGEPSDGHDTWITIEPLYLDRDVPGIPSTYSKAEAERRALYVRGIPASWQNEAVAVLLTNFGIVVKCPVLISLTSEHTFRWAIMATAEEAEHALGAMQGMLFQGNTLAVAMALKPGRTVHFSKPGPLDLTAPEPTSPPPARDTSAPTVHGHPSPTACVQLAENTEENISPVAVCPRSPVVRVAKTNVVAVPKELKPSSGTTAPTVPGGPDPTSSPAPSASPAPTTSDQHFVPVAASWASIASAANPSTSVVDLHPQRAVSGHRLQPIGRIPSVIRSEVESQAEQMRVVFLLNLPNNITLQDVSNAVMEGPLVKILFGYDEDAKTRFSGVVFQYAKDAEMFHNVLIQERMESKPDRFRFIVDCVRGDAFPADETIRAMADLNINASRRLTMVKKGFFFVLTERRLTALCHKIVGEEKVQLVWLYNGGNATVVFSDVAAAIKMKAELDRLTAGAGLPGGQPAAWAGLQTTFSKDPCQVPLELKTAIAG